MSVWGRHVRVAAVHAMSTLAEEGDERVTATLCTKAKCCNAELMLATIQTLSMVATKGDSLVIDALCRGVGQYDADLGSIWGPKSPLYYFLYFCCFIVCLVET